MLGPLLSHTKLVGGGLPHCCVGACYFDLVDPAALRVGRYGIGRFIGPPDAASIEKIICGTLRQLNVTVDEGNIKQDPEWSTLVEECKGLMPEPISLAVSNRLCTRRAKALAAGELSTGTEPLSLPDLREAVALIKRQTFRGQDLPGIQSLP